MDKKLIIFDLDGTLYQTHITSVAAVHRALSELGLPPLEVDVIISHFGEPMDTFCRSLVPTLTDESLAEFSRRINHYEKLYISQNPRLFEGVHEMLSELRDHGYELAICSNGKRDYIDAVLSACHIDHFFSAVRGREPGLTKSEAAGQIISELGASWVFIVGDRIHDIESAKANNAFSIGAAYGYGAREMEHADFAAASAGAVTGHVLRCELFHELEKKLASREAHMPYIFGINGVDTSGKSQLAAAFESYLSARGYKTAVIHIDDFHNPRAIRSRGADEINSYIENAFDLRLLETELLAPIKAGQHMEKQLTLLELDTDTFTRERHYHIDGDTVVLLEGTLLFREPVLTYIDCKVYLDISFDEVLRRAEARDVPLYGAGFLQRYREKYIPLQQWYIESCRPAEISDFVIDNEDFERPQMKRAK